MTHFLQDILRQPDELRGVIELLRGEGHEPRSRRRRGSWRLAMSISPASAPATTPHSAPHGTFTPPAIRSICSTLRNCSIPQAFLADSLLIVLSRSGRSIEIVKLMEKARAARCESHRRHQFSRTARSRSRRRSLIFSPSSRIMASLQTPTSRSLPEPLPLPAR